MATEATPVNGVYGTQYSQPAELAATIPSNTANHAPSGSQASAASSSAQRADPQEIGWYFVEQYYTTLSKSPEKIHLFYSKKSQLVTGVEAEKVVPALGTKAISEKIKALDFQDCKVRVLNVDSQSSFNNIVVQVIGEMSNKSEPHHKFVQTFVLAEQPNGYFVLNDIFRYLNLDEDEIVEDEQAQQEVPAEEPPTPVDESVPAKEADELVTSKSAVEEVDEKLEETKDEAVASETSEVNGEVAPTAEEEVAPASESAATTAEDLSETQQVTEPSTQSEAAPTEPPAKGPTPAPEGPPAKKTWASMLGGGSKPPAIPALPVTTPAQPKAPRQPQAAQASKPAAEPAAAAAPSTAATTTTSSTPTSQSNGWQSVGDKKAKPQNKVAEGTTLAYIKNVNEKVDARTLRETLEKFGELKYFDVNRQRNCAFVEFADPTGYAAAVAANPHAVGTESIYVEERHPRPGAYGAGNAPFNTRGASNAGRGRGGAQTGRSGSQTNFPKDAGRGGFQPRRGAKSGNVTPRGQGQAPAS